MLRQERHQIRAAPPRRRWRCSWRPTASSRCSTAPSRPRRGARTSWRRRGRAMADNGATLPTCSWRRSLIGDEGWRGFSFETLARRTGVSRVGYIASSTAGTRCWARSPNARTRPCSESTRQELAGLHPRDRIFELLMRRLETLVPYRAGLKRLAGRPQGSVRGPADRLPSGALLRLAAGRRRAALPWPARPRGPARSGSPTRALQCGSRTRAPISAGPWPSWTSSCAGFSIAGLREDARAPGGAKPPNPPKRVGQEGRSDGQAGIPVRLHRAHQDAAGL